MNIADKIAGRIKKAAADIAGDASVGHQGREEPTGEPKDELPETGDAVDRKAGDLADLERGT